MGYFNYFIKCIIRNFAYKLCKPKVFLTVLLCCLVLFGLHTKGYCAFEDTDLETIMDGFQSVTNNQGTIISQLSSMGINVSDIENQLNTIKSTLSTINTNTSNINTKLADLYNQVNSINLTLTQLAEQQNIQYQSLKNELELIREAVTGVEDEPTTDYEYIEWVSDSQSQAHQSVRGVKINYEPKYSYKIIIKQKNPWTSEQAMRVINLDSPLNKGFVYSDYASQFKFLAPLPPNNVETTITYNVPSSNPTYIYFNFAYFIQDIKVVKSINGISDSLNQNNDLQQESNQLQQEQNNFLQQGTSDSDVSIDSFNNVDANDITSSGLTGIFTTIYNSISSWSSKDIVLPIPFTNKSLTIPSNYTNNMLSSVGGGVLINIISTVYYFIVARFIVYSITGIINSIKSGSILETDTKNNITTDML